MMPVRYRVFDQFTRRGSLLASAIINRQSGREVHTTQFTRKGKNNNVSFSSLFRPVPVKLGSDDINVGAELSGNLRKTDLMKIITLFAQRPEIKKLALEYGLDSYLLTEALKSFRQYCMNAATLPVDLHITFSDVLQGAGNVSDIFPYFIRHAKSVFPHIDCLDDLKKISDLRCPANWYPVARSIPRKIIFHAGPTNSGKTYHALEKFMNAKSGVYCGPLKLLVSEIYEKTNKMGTACDLVTGEERRYAINETTPATHLSCSVEMVDLRKHYEVAVIDEIQLMRDFGRGWAWTRALLGVPANEIHLCGEEAAIDLVNSLCMTTGEDVEVRKYKRLTQLIIEDRALESFENVEPGDCIVCFNKSDIFTVTRALESRGKEVAVIYGSLPPGTKLAQASKFNDPDSSCKVMVATNAIGMGLNLHIRRIIFYSLLHPTVNEKGEREMETISVSSALQIAGRAGRYGTQWETGYVTAFRSDDLTTLKTLLHQKPDTLKKAGLHPTADQIELYAYHLPDTPLSNLMDIFVSLCTVDDSLYFMCTIDDFKFFADMIQHVPLPLRARYTFCCAPINRKMPFMCSMFLKFARQFSKNEKITFSWLCQHIGWPFTLPKSLLDLIHLEAVFDVLDLYLWLSYRFPDLFPDAKLTKDIQKELDTLIQQGIYKLAFLLRNADESSSTTTDNFEIQTRKQNFYRSGSYNRRRAGKGKLTDRLLSEGLLTPQMLLELQKEWSKDNPGGDNKKHKK